MLVREMSTVCNLVQCSKADGPIQLKSSGRSIVAHSLPIQRNEHFGRSSPVPRKHPSGTTLCESQYLVLSGQLSARSEGSVACVVTISAESCADSRQIALSPAFRALDPHDLPRGLRRQPEKSHSRLHFRALDTHDLGAYIALSPTFRALDTQDLRRVGRTPESHSRLHFAHSTRTISAEGCAGTCELHSRLHFARHARSPQRVAISRKEMFFHQDISRSCHPASVNVSVCPSVRVEVLVFKGIGIHGPGSKQPKFPFHQVLPPALHSAMRLCRQSALSSKVQAEEKQHIEGHMSLTKEGNLSSPSDTESGRQMPVSNGERALQTCKNQQCENL